MPENRFSYSLPSAFYMVRRNAVLGTGLASMAALLMVNSALPGRCAEAQEPAGQPASAPVQTQAQTQAQEQAVVADKPFKATWPAGWELVEMASPTPDSGKQLGGLRIRAIKVDDNVPTIIELTYFPVRTQSHDSVDDQLASVLKNVKESYEAKGLPAAVGEVKKARLGGLDAVDAAVTVTAPKFLMIQSFSLAFGKNYLYSLTFTGRKEQYEKYQPIFQTFRESMILQ